MKKLICALLCLALAGCSVQEGEPAPSPSPSPEEGQAYQIGLVQFQEGEPANEVREAFMSRLEEWGCGESQVSIDYQCADGDLQRLEEICAGFAQEGADLVVAVSTQATQAAVDAAQGGATQVLATGVATVPQGEGVTGVASPSQTEALVDLALQADGDLATLGVLYDPADPDAAAAVEQAKALCAERGLEVVESAVSAQDQVPQAMADLCAQADAVFSPGDGTVAPQAAQAAEAALSAGKPWYVGQEEMVRAGALVGVGFPARDAGAKAADLAVLLVEGQEFSQVPAVTLDQSRTWLNQATQQALGLSLPQEVTAAAFVVA